MKNMADSRKFNNRGFSLVELMVAVGISSIVSIVIVAFIMSTTRSFNKQTNSIDLQNELQEASNKVSDCMMESTKIKIEENGDLLCIYTGDFDAEDNKVSPRLIVYVKTGDNANSLYVMDTIPTDLCNPDVCYRMSRYVTDFEVTIASVEAEKETTAEGETGETETASIDKKYKQPLMFTVKMEVSNRGESRADEKTITLRNKMPSFEYKGRTYELVR